MSKIIGSPLYAPTPAGGGQTAGSLAVGSSVFTNVNGTKTEFIVVHQGKPSSALYDGSCDGTWLLAKDIHARHVWNSTLSNQYANSDINTWLNNDFLTKFDSDVKNIIAQVKIPYGAGDKTSTVYSGSNGLSVKIFLLGGYEVGWTTSDSSNFVVDGTKLDYFESGTGTAANDRRVAQFDGGNAFWWTRTPVRTNDQVAFYVSSNGSIGQNNYVVANSGIRPAFIIPSITNITKGGLIKP